MNLKLKFLKGFTLIELLVVISIIALLSSVIIATITKTRIRARDSARIQNARQLAIALEQYEQSNNTYKISNAGYNNTGGGFAAKGAETSGYTNSIVSALKSSGYYSSTNLLDPVYGTDNYYVGLCTSTNAYNVFVKLEQPQYNNSTSSISNSCGGAEASSLGFSFIASTAGGSSGGGSSDSGFSGATESIPYVASVGSLDSTYIQGTGSNSYVYAAAIQSDGKVVVGGAMTTYNGVARNYIARVNVDGTTDTSFNPGAGPNSMIRAMAIQSDGKIVVGGTFTTYGGISRGYVARVNTDGSLDTTFAPSTGSDNTIYSLVIQPDGKIIIGGLFTTYNGVSRNGVARINTDGSLDTTFNPGVGISSAVRALAVQSDGKILIGGLFTSYNSVARNYLVRTNTDGSIDAAFNSAAGPSGAIYLIAVQSDGKIIIGGNAVTYNGVTTNRILRINSDSTLDATFNSGTGVNSTPVVATIQPDGKILIGGLFTTYNGVSRNYIARANIDGSLDTTFNPGGGANSSILAILIQSDGKVILGGNQTSYNGSTSNYLTRVK